MSATQNITLRVPSALLRRVKRLAAERESSVSALLIAALDAVDARSREYDTAMRHALHDLSHPAPLGTRDRARWTRDQLHER